MPRGHQKGQHCKWREFLDRSGWGAHDPVSALAATTTTTEDPPMMCMARMRTGADLTQTTVKVTTINRNTTKGAQRMVTFTAGMIQAVKVDLQPSWE